MQLANKLTRGEEMRRFAPASMAVLLSACGGHIAYKHPEEPTVTKQNYERIINKPKDEVWDKAIVTLSRNFFVINNIDKASGLINLSYAGGPENYIDCGVLSFHVKNLRFDRTYEFPAQSPQENFTYFHEGTNYGFRNVDRKVELEGRMNIVIQDAGAGQTRASANVRYIVISTAYVSDPAHNTHDLVRDTGSFNSGGIAHIGAPGNTFYCECKATGVLENQMLDLLN